MDRSLGAGKPDFLFAGYKEKVALSATAPRDKLVREYIESKLKRLTIPCQNIPLPRIEVKYRSWMIGLLAFFLNDQQEAEVS